jgi:hypothetical protein
MRKAIGDDAGVDPMIAGGGSVALRAHANNMIVTAEAAGVQSLIANRTTIGPWEEFDLITS